VWRFLKRRRFFSDSRLSDCNEIKKRGIDTMSSEEMLREIAAEVSTCSKCKLCKGRTRAVPGEGNPNAKILFIGEGPGYHEDQQGRPFVGPAGQFLDELLASINLKRSDVFIANVVKCRPPQNRDPEPDEMAACNDYLDRQIAAIKPRVIVTLGRYSMSKFFGGEKISAIHGRARKRDGYICIAMYHPAAGLHQASLKDVIREDFKKIPLVIAEADRMAAEPPPQPLKPKDEPPQQLSLF
jgi:uracil-DNA glycosylase family 4